MSARPFPWERNYPPGLGWDIDIPAETIPAMIARSVAENAAQPALDYRDRETGFAELGIAIGEVAAGLASLGHAKGERIALYLPNVPAHPFCFYGALTAGLVVAHLSPLDAERELAHKLHDSGARTLVTTNLGAMLGMALKLLDAGHVERLVVADDAAFGEIPGMAHPPIPTGDQRVMTLDALRARGRAFEFEPPAIAPGDLALLQYTGGTTGLPKGAMHTHATLRAAVAIYATFFDGQNRFPPGQKFRAICVLPLFHIYALVVLCLLQLSRGSTLLLRLKFDAETTLRDIEVKKASYFPGVPTMWIALANVPDLDRRDLSSLRLVGSGGAPLPVEIGQRFERLTGMRLGGGWGMTETASAGTGNLLDGLFKFGSAGMPLPGIKLDVVALDDPSRVLPYGETGEIRIRSPNTFIGYWQNPEETARSFVDGHFLTGDVGYIDEDGMVFLVDRKKDMILSGGFNVYPTVIESAIYEHPDVAEVIVVGVPDDYRGQSAKAFITLKPGAAEFTIESLRDFLADKLGKHELPAALEFRETLPKTSVGKFSRKELAAEERDAHAAARASSAAAS
ncbi:MAG TPA: AMP-binding protein [Acidiphilium sp.]|uniref:AMP-binding protein n=1 Tax=unclassified Acidiphilium TaxID=2617493 RepID=UPI000BCF3BB9|nr:MULTISPECIES: AMP-binding protein [unclassified Acidiphilium]OYV55601.1 MAG: dicarboxylate--CoA ligase PimA [Acidiphilium sp. 20-67-58]HQT60188.1 AMP-binding protein [Acidiphilium sp.]HQU10804.1 AMP-binding protein [Acidiphilium sp.]